jgi:hypothetical protein
MKVTYVIKGKTQYFFDQLGTLDNAGAFAELQKCVADKMNVTRKIGTGQMRDAVDLNTIVKGAAPTFTFKIEPRAGYKLATFDIV